MRMYPPTQVPMTHLPPPAAAARIFVAADRNRKRDRQMQMKRMILTTATAVAFAFVINGVVAPAPAHAAKPPAGYKAMGQTYDKARASLVLALSKAKKSKPPRSVVKKGRGAVTGFNQVKKARSPNQCAATGAPASRSSSVTIRRSR